MSAIPTPAVRRVLEALERCGCEPKPNGRGWIARCPAHEDRNPSLSIGVGDDGRALLNCHAGCSTPAVVGAVGLEERDLFDAPTSPPGTRPRPRSRVDAPFASSRDGRPEVARYVYTLDGAKGEALKVRYGDGEAKTFSWYERDGGGFLVGLAGKAPDLYLLRQVREGIDRGALIVLNEGEKAVERARVHDGDDALDFVATCGPNGESSFRRDGARLAEQLRGAAKVLAVVDRDDAGNRWADDVRRTVGPVVGKLWFARAAVDAPKADLFDHFEAGHAIADLAPVDPVEVDAPSTAEARIHRAVNLYDASIVPTRPEFTVKNLIRRAGLHLVWAEPSAGKTWTLLRACHELLADTGRGRLWGHPELWINRRWKRALWIATEEDAPTLRYKAEWVRRGLNLAKLEGELLYLFAAAHPRVTLEHLPEIIRTEGPLDAIILDSLTGLRPKTVNGERVRWDVDNDAANEMCLRLRAMATEHALAIFLVHHTGRDASKGYRGPTDWWASADVMFGLIPDGGRAKVKVEKNRDGRRVPAFFLSPAWDGSDEAGTYTLAYEGAAPSVKLTPTAEKLLAWARGLGRQFAQKEAVETKPALGARTTVVEAMKVLEGAGLLRATGNSVAGSPIYAVTDEPAEDPDEATEGDGKVSDAQ